MAKGDKHVCKRCGQLWKQRLASFPKRCTGCRSPYWQTAAYRKRARPAGAAGAEEEYEITDEDLEHEVANA